MPSESNRELAARIVRGLTEAGHLAFWVGGCVRDRLLGIEPKDYDIATSATPGIVLDMFPGASLVGTSFGVVLIPGGVEVATFRSEKNYADGRHPSEVSYETDPALDASRRDFTINALYYNPLGDETIDFTGGRQDLADKVIRAIGKPQERFEEDHLRLLRAIRFAARFRFTIEPITLEAITTLAPAIRRISGERIHAEMHYILTGHNLDIAWHYLDQTRLWRHLVPEANQGQRLASLEPPVTSTLAWAALLEGVPNPREVFNRFRFSREESTLCQDLLDSQPLLLHPQKLSIPTLKRLVRKPNFSDHLHLHRATHGATQAFQNLLELQSQWTHDQLWPAPLITGEDLIAYGLSPGPKFRDILTRIEDAQLEGRLNDRQEALRLALS